MRILVAEDDIILNSSITKKLIARGFTVDYCYDGEEALYMGKENIHDVILLDRMLPSMDGCEVLKQLRASNVSVPIIFTTALGTLDDKVKGLTLGADDYLVKPFEFEELYARIQCVSRRSISLNKIEANKLTHGDLIIDTNDHQLKGPSGCCTLANKEYSLLEVFLRNPGQTLSRQNILLKVWGPDSDVEEGNLDNYIFFIRRRIKQVGSNLTLKTIRGVGYQLV